MTLPASLNAKGTTQFGPRGGNAITVKRYSASGWMPQWRDGGMRNGAKS